MFSHLGNVGAGAIGRHRGDEGNLSLGLQLGGAAGFGHEPRDTRRDTRRVLFSKTMCDGYKQCATYNREKRNNPGGSLGTAAEDAWDHRTQ